MRLDRYHFKVKILILLGLFTLCCFQAGCDESNSNSENKPLSIVGTGACEAVLNKLAQAYNSANPDSQVTAPKSIGSGRGIEVVGKGQYVLGRVARPLKEKESQYDLTYKSFAKDGVVFAVGEKASVRDLSADQLVDIYSGKTTNWSELGGDDGPIRALAREEGDSSRSIIEKQLCAFKDVVYSDRIKYVYHDYEMVEMLGKYPTSIGWLTWSNLNQDMFPISINGNEPTSENISSGKYPLICEYAFVYQDKRLTETARKFLDFVFSEKGARILELNGLIPVKGD